MAIKLASLTLCLLHLSAVLAAPLLESKEAVNTLEAIEDASDSESVGSYVREVRAAPPDDGDYHRSHEGEGNGEIGYSRKKVGGGKKGYQQFDSYHKKAGDHYEFEKQDSFGHDEEGQDGAYSHLRERRVPRENKRERIREPEEFKDEHEEAEDSEEKKSKQQEDKHHEDKHHGQLREGSPNGNGGVEAYGHDPRDYILPEKYTYGEAASEYDF